MKQFIVSAQPTIPASHYLNNVRLFVFFVSPVVLHMKPHRMDSQYARWMLRNVASTIP